MNRTIEGSREFDIICMSFGKNLEKGIEVVEANKKDSFIEAEAMVIKVGNCTDKDMNLSKEQQKVLIDNRTSRKTTRAIRKTKTASQR